MKKVKISEQKLKLGLQANFLSFFSALIKPLLQLFHATVHPNH